MLKDKNNIIPFTTLLVPCKCTGYGAFRPLPTLYSLSLATVSEHWSFSPRDLGRITWILCSPLLVRVSGDQVLGPMPLSPSGASPEPVQRVPRPDRRIREEKLGDEAFHPRAVFSEKGKLKKYFKNFLDISKLV